MGVLMLQTSANHVRPNLPFTDIWLAHQNGVRRYIDDVSRVKRWGPSRSRCHEGFSSLCMLWDASMQVEPLPSFMIRSHGYLGKDLQRLDPVCEPQAGH